MSLVMAESTKDLAFNLWNSPKLPRDPKHAIDCKWYDLIPLDEESLAEWLVLRMREGSHDRTRPFEVVYASGPDDDEIFSVSLRIQGVLGAHNLSPNGNWTKKVDDTSHARAVQTLTLEGGGNIDAWLPTLRCLNNICAVVARLADTSIQSNGARRFDEAPETVVPFQRRVFIKTAHGMSYAQHGQSRWMLDDSLIIGALDLHGKLRTSNHIGLSIGDLVDVTFSLEVATRPDRPVQVHFKPDRLVRLVSKHKPRAPVTRAPQIPRALYDLAIREDEESQVDGDLEGLAQIRAHENMDT